MMLEPVSALPRSRRRRGARLLGLATPAVLLVSVVAGGLLGSTAGPPATATAAPQRTPGPLRSPAPPPGVTTLTGGGPAWPTVVDDLAVRTVSEALDLRRTIGPNDMVAVAGYLVVTPATGCAQAGPDGLGPLCERSGTLLELPTTEGIGGDPAPGPHLVPRFPPGVRVPAGLGDPGRRGGRGLVSAVIVGRFGPDGGRCPTRLECDLGFLADQVAWMDGTRVTSPPVIDAGIDANPPEWMLVNEDNAIVAAIGRSKSVLVAALLRPATVASVDPDAGRRLASGPQPAALVWYVRGLDTGYDPTRYPLGQAMPRLSWVLLDDVTGEVLARGPADPGAQPSR